MQRALKRRLLIGSVVTLGAFLSLTALVHLPVVQHAMGWTTPDGEGACPFGHGAKLAKPTSVPRDGQLASGRPALGFRLATTSRDDVMRWASTHDVACAPKRGRSSIECSDVPGALLDEHGVALAGTMWLELDEHGLVRTINTVRRAGSAEQAAEAFSATQTALRSKAGTPTVLRGSAEPEALASGAFQQAMFEYRLSDYRAVVRATNMGDGYILTESYTAL